MQEGPLCNFDKLKSIDESEEPLFYDKLVNQHFYGSFIQEIMSDVYTDLWYYARWTIIDGILVSIKSFERNNRCTISRKIFPSLNVESIIWTIIIVVYSLISSIHQTSIDISTERAEILELSIICWWTDSTASRSATIYAISTYLTTIEVSVKIPKILKMSINCDLRSFKDSFSLFISARGLNLFNNKSVIVINISSSLINISSSYFLDCYKDIGCMTIAADSIGCMVVGSTAAQCVAKQAMKVSSQ